VSVLRTQGNNGKNLRERAGSGTVDAMGFWSTKLVVFSFSKDISSISWTIAALTFQVSIFQKACLSRRISRKFNISQG